MGPLRRRLRKEARLRLNQGAGYGFLCLRHLARSNGRRWTGGAEIAAKNHLPQAYLTKILRKLRRAGIVTSCRGRGYKLARPLKEIRALDFLEAFGFDATRHNGRHTNSKAMDSIRRQVIRWLSGMTLKSPGRSA